MENIIWNTGGNGIVCYAHFHDTSNQDLKSSSEYVILALYVRLIY